MTTNEELFERGLRVMPGGVNSPVRAFRSVGGVPYQVARGEGSRVWDVEGNEFIDYVQSYGASILGHANPAVIETIREAALSGTTFGAPTEREVLLAETLVDRVPGLEMVRLVSSGTEAAMSSVRLARGVTGRSKILKFAGNYHGHTDALLVAGGSSVAEQATSDSAGVTAGAVADTVVAPFNVVPQLDESFAVVCVEPVAANMGLVEPAPGFLQGLRDECDRVGALLLFDEVITGFRLDHGGATAFYDVVPDVWCFGKVIGGGLPMGAYGSSADVMGNIAPLGPVYQAGTLSGNPLATAAGLAVLHQLNTDAYATLIAKATALAEGLSSSIAEDGISVRVPQVGPLLGIFFDETVPTNFEEAKAVAENGHYRRFFREMLDRGVALAPGPYEALFPSLAHSDADIAQTVHAAGEAAAVLANG
jgi:glutamate-1-semialdehyde 2,1-aminomutase